MSDELQLRGGFTTRDRRLDRVPYHDPRSRNYQLRPVLGSWAQLRAERSPSRYPAHPTLDQGREGACVGFSVATMLNASPHRADPEWDGDRARWLYREAQKVDEWPGEHYEGTSIVAAMRVAQGAGLIGEYRWLGAGSGRLGDDVVDCCERVGTFIAGIPVYGSMFDPEPGGIWRVDPTSGLYGYHAICVLDYRHAPLPYPTPPPGTSRRRIVDHLVVQNTWGRAWGDEWYGMGGCAYLPLEDALNHLLPAEVWGEAVTFIEAPVA